MTKDERSAEQKRIYEFEKIQREIVAIETAMTHLKSNNYSGFYINNNGSTDFRVNSKEDTFGYAISANSIIKLALENCKNEILSAYQIQLKYLQMLQSKI